MLNGLSLNDNHPAPALLKITWKQIIGLDVAISGLLIKSR